MDKLREKLKTGKEGKNHQPQLFSKNLEKIYEILARSLGVFLMNGKSRAPRLSDSVGIRVSRQACRMMRTCSTFPDSGLLPCQVLVLGGYGLYSIHITRASSPIHWGESSHWSSLLTTWFWYKNPSGTMGGTHQDDTWIREALLSPGCTDSSPSHPSLAQALFPVSPKKDRKWRSLGQGGVLKRIQLIPSRQTC